MFAVSDGRKLAYNIVGPPDGAPVVHCHGTPGSRHEPVLSGHPENASWPRIITIDRPGYGDSAQHDAPSLASHAADIAALADHLGLERFSLSGFSGGGPFALACASTLGRRVRAVLLIASPAAPLMHDPLTGTGELTAALWRLATDDPHALASRLEPLVENPDTLATTMIDALGEADRVLLKGTAAQAFSKSITTALRQGPAITAAAMARDMHLYTAPWGFDPREIRQPVIVFHGREDRILHPAHGEHLADALPHARLEIAAGHGHYGGLYGTPAPRLWQALIE